MIKRYIQYIYICAYSISWLGGRQVKNQPYVGPVSVSLSHHLKTVLLSAAVSCHFSVHQMLPCSTRTPPTSCKDMLVIGCFNCLHHHHRSLNSRGIMLYPTSSSHPLDYPTDGWSPIPRTFKQFIFMRVY